MRFKPYWKGCSYAAQMVGTLLKYNKDYVPIHVGEAAPGKTLLKKHREGNYWNLVLRSCPMS